MQATNTTFRQMIFGPKQFLIPVFQRDYKWREDNWEKLWADICASGSVGHFAGSIVHAPDTSFSSIPTYLVIDGQQRLATLIVLCAALRDHINETDWANDGAGQTASQIDQYCLKNDLEIGERRYKLVLRRTDNDVLRLIMDGASLVDADNQGSSLIDEAYHYFLEKLGEQSVDLGRLYRGIMELRVVEMTLDRNIDNPQSVFESMNSTGVNLSQGDLVRNYLLMGVEEVEQTRLYERYWNKIESLFKNQDSALDFFVRDYIALKQGDTRQARTDQIYDQFKRFRRSRFAAEPLEDQLWDMLRFASFYAKFRGFENEPHRELSDALTNLRHHGDTTGLLVMRLFESHHDGSLELAGLITALNAIESYLMRRAISRSQTRAYWGNFAGLARQVEENAPLGSLLYALTQQRGTYSFPTDPDFRLALQEREMYGSRVCWQLLSRLENHGTREPSPTSTYSIEHIMPQNKELPLDWQSMLGEGWQEIHETWLHRLGNLTLTAYNSRYSDRPFHEKKTTAGGFNESAVRLNAYVREQEAWNADSIEERGRLLSDRSLSIWEYPLPSPEYLEARRGREVRRGAEETNINDVILSMTDAARDLFGPLHQGIDNLAAGIRAVQERNSICYYTSDAEFFLELLPRKRSLMLLLDADIAEIEAPSWLAKDGNDWKFVPNSTLMHPYGVVVEMWQSSWADDVMRIIRQGYQLVSN